MRYTTFALLVSFAAFMSCASSDKASKSDKQNVLVEAKTKAEAETKKLEEEKAAKEKEEMLAKEELEKKKAESEKQREELGAVKERLKKMGLAAVYFPITRDGQVFTYPGGAPPPSNPRSWITSCSDRSIKSWISKWKNPTATAIITRPVRADSKRV